MSPGARPTDVRAALEGAVRECRLLFVAGLPASGKSTLMRLAALAAAEAGRVPHLLQWDVARLAFDRPEILARYPEVGGVTHAAIRLGVGAWVRDAVLRWHEAHGPEHILIGETPLVGNRLVELARPRDDALEPLLAAAPTRFLVPVPARQIRALIEAARARDTASPRDAHDSASAPPHLVTSHWDDIEQVARDLGVPVARPGSYDAALYEAVYLRLLRHRRARVVHIDEALPPVDAPAAPQLVPTPAEVQRAISLMSARPDDELEREAEEWYRM